MVPRNRLNPTFRFGFLISPAIKVTPTHASLENKDPTIAAEIPVSKAEPPIGIQDPFSVSNALEPHALVQLAFQISALAAKMNPKTINPNKDKILIIVNI